MWNGIVISIHIAPTVGAPMVSRNSIRAVTGQGLEGDRYFLGEGFYSWFGGPLREVSLKEMNKLLNLFHMTSLPAELVRVLTPIKKSEL